MSSPNTPKTIRCVIDKRTIKKYRQLQSGIGSRLTLADEACSGLLLVLNKRSASWQYYYRQRGMRDGGKRHPQEVVTLGDPSIMTPHEARAAAERMKGIVRTGENPKDVLAAEMQKASERKASKVLGEWLQAYTERHLTPASKHNASERRNAAGALADLGITSSAPNELTAARLRELADLHADRPATSRHRFGAVSRFADFLVDEGALPLNPALQVSKRHKPRTPKPRTRFHTPDELARLWSAEGLKPVYLSFLRFLISTPLREGEASELTWARYDAERAELILRPEDTKNSEAFVMPLSAAALSTLPANAGNVDQRIWQLSRTQGAPMKSWSHFLRVVRDASGIPDFGPHNLRRSFVTLMSENTDVSEVVLDGMLNHKMSASRGGVMGHYQHAQNLKKRRQAIEEWSILLGGWVNGSRD